MRKANGIMQHPLLITLKSLRGNPKACVYTEPLWGLSINLCLPYASVFMVGLHLSDTYVGVVASIYMFSQMFFSFLSGIITDKLGRRKTTVIFDFVGWSLPCLIWAFSEGFWFFAVAALLNGAMKVPTVSWDCLLVEDAPKDQISKLYTLILMAGSSAALFAPISSILVARFTLIPAIRILYLNAFVVMTIKVLILYRFSKETSVGLIRQQETKGRSLRSLTRGYLPVFREMLRSKATVFSIIVSVLVEITMMIYSTFWQIIASRRIGITDAMLPIFPMLSSLLSLFFYFFVIAHLNQKNLKRPLLWGFSAAAASCLLLILIGPNHPMLYPLLLGSIALNSLGGGLLGVLRESIVAISVDPHERSRIMALLHMVVMLISVPFGYIGGMLSDLHKT
ncbi:MAG: MFS transporter, partial [Lachnospiraceae bacterium]|jgi:MFS family permease|nr:MFS transporter [Lachnospiraceae bacterium]